MPAHIPWCKQEEWDQILPFFFASCRKNTEVARAAEIAGEIARKITSVDECLQELCRRTCPSCMENCCARADIWFDFRDLLFLFLLNEELPPRQIRKTENHGCMNLTPKGCRLKRFDRPFVCNWYICPDQKAKSRLLQHDVCYELWKILQEVQYDRKEMEAVFIGGIRPNVS